MKVKNNRSAVEKVIKNAGVKTGPKKSEYKFNTINFPVIGSNLQINIKPGETKDIATSNKIQEIFCKQVSKELHLDIDNGGDGGDSFTFVFDCKPGTVGESPFVDAVLTEKSGKTTSEASVGKSVTTTLTSSAVSAFTEPLCSVFCMDGISTDTVLTAEFKTFENDIALIGEFAYNINAGELIAISNNSFITHPVDEDGNVDPNTDYECYFAVAVYDNDEWVIGIYSEDFGE